ncbi:MAG TPA: hypothetical protein VN420_01880 [Candidatus Fimivivens sp.]|nr:hypothetical protein [Candidatus Fimivivens sp.]
MKIQMYVPEGFSTIKSALDRSFEKAGYRLEMCTAEAKPPSTDPITLAVRMIPDDFGAIAAGLAIIVSEEPGGRTKLDCGLAIRKYDDNTHRVNAQFGNFSVATTSDEIAGHRIYGGAYVTKLEKDLDALIQQILPRRPVRA